MGLLSGERLMVVLLCNEDLKEVESKEFERRGRRREKEGEKGGAGIPVNS